MRVPRPSADWRIIVCHNENTITPTMTVTVRYTSRICNDPMGIHRKLSRKPSPPSPLAGSTGFWRLAAGRGATLSPCCSRATTCWRPMYHRRRLLSAGASGLLMQTASRWSIAFLACLTEPLILSTLSQSCICWFQMRIGTLSIPSFGII